MKGTYFFNVSGHKTIFFNSHDISKPDSTSSLTILDPSDKVVVTPLPDSAKVQRIVSTLRKELGMSLFGIDVVIENGSGRYGIIDINAFPGDAAFSYCTAPAELCTIIVVIRIIILSPPLPLMSLSSSLLLLSPLFCLPQ
jgi:inositol-1,3,4-trisphosphate 5/6-kinase/inositol-tetrakisphosphate 1-kinase